MKKEILISILIGFGIGILITFGVYTSRKAIEKSNQIISPRSENLENEPEASPTISLQSLSIVSPIDESITNEGKIFVSGSTSPDSWVILLSEKGERVIMADKKGSFETEVLLISGENEIEVQSISETGEKTSKIVTVVYSTAEI